MIGGLHQQQPMIASQKAPARSLFRRLDSRHRATFRGISDPDALLGAPPRAETRR
jgi:hypothetical protein